jgi:hypothetical protein
VRLSGKKRLGERPILGGRGAPREPGKQMHVTKGNFTMAAQGHSLFERIARWELIDRTLAPLIENLPHLKEAHAELQRIIAEAKQLEDRFEQRRSEWRDASVRRVDLLKRGDELRGRLAAALQFEHGFKSVKLMEFGLKPRRTRGRAKPKENPPEVKPPPTTTPTEPPTPASKAAEAVQVSAPPAT